MRRWLTTFVLGMLMAATLSGAPARAGEKMPTILGVIAGLSVLTGTIFEITQPDANTAFVGFAVGAFDVIDSEDESTEFRLEFQPGFQVWRVKPLLGVFATSDGGIGGYFGIGHDLNIGEHIVLNVNTAATFYAAGKGKHLGSYAVLRSGAELGYRFDNASRLSITLHHMSHGELFDDKNPGTEIVGITYAIPLTKLLGR